MKRIWNLILVLTLLGILAYLALKVFSDPKELRHAFSNFEWRLLPFILMLSLCSYIFRFLRWNLYCSRLDIKMRKRQNIGIFGSGLVAGLSPLKSGELAKSFLLKKNHNVEVNRSAPMVVMEQMTDFGGKLLLSGAALFLCALLGLTLTPYKKYISASFSFLILVIIFILTGVLATKNIDAQIPLLSRILGWTRNFFTATRKLCYARIIASSLGFSITAWLSQSAGFYFVLKGFDVDLPFIVCIFIFNSALIVGVLTFIPGGIIGTEAFMVLLLISCGIDQSESIAATIVIRACTLWFGVFVGFVAFASYSIFSHWFSDP